MAKKYINIQFPFVNSKKGFFLELTETDKEAIKSDLMHLILTTKGERFYMPNFGTNLLKYIFEPLDGYTEVGIKEEITTVVKTYLPNLVVNDVTIDKDTDNEYTAIVRIDYTITEDVFNTSDFVIINI
jgi:hypothetical protein